MKKIPLTQGQFALVDDEDFDKLMKWKWFTMKRGKKKKKFHAARKLKKATIYMHHAIIGKPKNNLVVDHKNGDGLDNRKKNLRFCSRADNSRNLKESKRSFGILGVSWHTRRKKFVAQIMVNRKNLNLGGFDTEEEALKARKLAEKKYWKTS